MLGKFRVMPEIKVDIQPVLLESLRTMKSCWGVCGLKLSTEDAAMSLDQIDYWMHFCQDFLPVVVKIGGPNARNDIRQLVKLGVDGLIAPMVESAFGLENYMEALRNYTSPVHFQKLGKYINLETKTAVQQLDSILDSPSARCIDGISIGRKDLSRSMNCQIDSPKVESAVSKIITKVFSRNFKISIGGGINPKTIDSMIATHSPDQFNTRTLTFRVNSHLCYRQAVQSALKFEITALKNDASQGFISREEENCRAVELQKRLAS